MTALPTHTRAILLAARPHGAPTPETFARVDTPLPPLKDGELLLELLYLSLDPYMRGRMNDGPSYVPPFVVGAPLTGGAVSRVLDSRDAKFAVGDLVLGHLPWQDVAVSTAKGLIKLDPALTQPSQALGVLGMPAFTAWYGLLKIGEPRAGDTVVVAAASGAVGSVVGQIAKIKGARVVGIAGGTAKCKSVIDELGFDACVDHRAPDFAQKLTEAVPKGIDVYFENVGGAVFDAVLPLLNVGARVPLCGVIAHYNDTDLPPGPDRLSMLTLIILKKRLRVQGFIIADHNADRSAFLAEMGPWVADGRIKFREDVVDGLENAPQALIGLLEGRNYGKLVIRAKRD